jgi:hypothetical protein
MTTKYHTRQGYERLYFQLLAESGRPPSSNIHTLSDYHLLVAIDRLLNRFECMPFTPHEFEMELH